MIKTKYSKQLNSKSIQFNHLEWFIKYKFIVKINFFFFNLLSLNDVLGLGVKKKLSSEREKKKDMCIYIISLSKTKIY